MGQFADIRDMSPDFATFVALKQIEADYGVSVYIKPKMLSKFGRYSSLGTSATTVQEHGGNETYQTANTIDTIVSTDAGDTQTVLIEGHTIDGNNDLTFVVQSATLNGTTNVTLTTPLARATRIKNVGTTNFGGTVKVIDADAPSVIFVQATGVQADGKTFNRSQKAATSTSKDDFWIITSVFGATLKKTAASVDFSLQVREKGKVFQEVYAFDGVAGDQDRPHLLTVPIIVPNNSDVRLVAVASTTGVEVVGRVSGYLATIE